MSSLPLAHHLSRDDDVPAMTRLSSADWTDESLYATLGVGFLQPELVHPEVRCGAVRCGEVR